MKEELCQAFCNSISVRSVPTGLAISTTVASIDGDPIGFYIVGPMEDGRYKIEDSGLVVPALYAAGADLENETRKQAFDVLLSENSASYDHESMEIVSEPMVKADVPGAALRFVSLLLHVSDLSLMAHDKAASTFKNDATVRLRERLPENAIIQEGGSLSDESPDWEPDLVIRADSREPVALFLVQTDHRALEAMLLKADIDKANARGRVVALLENVGSITKKIRVHAANRLDVVPIFSGDEATAINRIATEALGRRRGVLH